MTYEKKTKLKFVRWAGSSHINYLNIGLYEQGPEHYLARVERVTGGRSLGMRTVKREDFDTPLSLRGLAREIEQISGINLFDDA